MAFRGASFGAGEGKEGAGGSMGCNVSRIQLQRGGSQQSTNPPSPLKFVRRFKSAQPNFKADKMRRYGGVTFKVGQTTLRGLFLYFPAAFPFPPPPHAFGMKDS